MSDAPTGIRPTLLSVTVHGDGDAVLSLDGPTRSGDIARTKAVLSVLLGTGVQHLIVDLSTASPLPTALSDELRRVEALLLARGGWLLVAGVDGSPQELMDAVRAYQETLARTGSASDAVPVGR